MPNQALGDERFRCDPVHRIVAKTTGNAFGRTVCADVVALDQALVYNRFGSFNPFGMMFALRRDVVATTRKPEHLTADACDKLDGTETHGDTLKPGAVRLKDCKRPRPLVLRANAGDVLHVRLTNLLMPEVPGLSENFCGAEKGPTTPSRGDDFHFLRRWVSEGDQPRVDHGEAMCAKAKRSPGAGEPDGNWPATRQVNFAIQGLRAFGISGGAMTEANPACLGLTAIETGATVDCYYMVDREGPFFIASSAAPSGGQGDGGSLTHGLFGGVMAQKTGTRWYRSQVSRAAFRTVWSEAHAARHAVDAVGDLARYETRVGDVPVLNMLKPAGDANTFELVHNDLNAIVYNPKAEKGSDTPVAFREFSVFFHDELKTFYTRNFEELGDFGAGQLAGVRDGFAINYGASGMGDMLLANRKGIGPAANCVECLYEEFFLTSWANGDPALLEHYSDDPSNVHHSYLNDAVVYRNFHAGPKETHVFHLHAHQWFAGNDTGRGSYLDSQTVAPQQGFSYDIYGGGMEVYRKGTGGKPGWYETLGSGNRNRTPGDSIFHCHLYPHFAQGMWELWRVHDVLEDGSRKLPDGQWEPTLSLAEMDKATRAKKRPGSVDPATGRWIEPASGLARSAVGTPIPALVPLPGQPWPLLPTYPKEPAVLHEDGSVKAEPVEKLTGFPGYPFYIGGKPGHRPPQAPMDIARRLSGDDVTEDYLDGGLPRHVMLDGSKRVFPFNVPALPELKVAVGGPVASLADAEASAAQKDREAVQSQIVAKSLALGDLTMKLKEAEIALLDYDGEPIERTGMGFHHDGTANGSPLILLDAEGNGSSFVPDLGGYKSPGGSNIFTVNGAPPKPGAPFADPCGAPSGMAQVQRVAADDYRVQVGAVSFALYQAPAGTVPDPGTPRIPATDATVSNWVSWQRTDTAARPVLFYADAGGEHILSAPALITEEDPFLLGTGAKFVADPAVIGYRRYEGSAVQVDLVTNRAGWHDPQARINVLTARSDSYKDGNGRISPKVTASEEPFFFRALSGECIEFRHTNELPKELELDDFQVKTPTDTIGQHIHLVKFDVTASDGSGNGFNYEDGTLAADEIALRICAAKNTASTALVSPSRGPGELLVREYPGLCVQDAGGHWSVSETYKGSKAIWRRKLSQHRELFQTTTQRWFADPILSEMRAPGDAPDPGRADRTLRTVFSHDHFGPSSIQQHGFYTALLIEPQEALICDENGSGCTPPRVDRRLEVADDRHVGARKVLIDLLPHDVDSTEYREFAISIADFATLYDPRRSVLAETLLETMPEMATDSGGDASEYTKGIATLLCEARYAQAGQPRNMQEICGSDLSISGSGASPNLAHGEPGDLPPAWVAAKMPGDDPAHSGPLVAGLLTPAEVEELKTYLLDWRRMAAGYAPGDRRAPLATPVAPPARPESISVDHHDPYLVNYRGEPFPLRLGEDSSVSSDCALKPLSHWVFRLSTAGVSERCHISRQASGPKGDFANVFLSRFHGEPVTPILQTFDGDQVMIRLIQGAQEVQHTFNLDGYNWPRNIDQQFPSGAPILDDVAPRETLVKACEHHPVAALAVRLARMGRPDEYRDWMRYGPAADPFWIAFEEQLASCFNMEGRIVAQEIGISEHFEFRAAYRHDGNLESAGSDEISNPELRRIYDDLGRLLHLLAPSDTLLHFGSTDALWNGAWGLLRVKKTTYGLASLSLAETTIAEITTLREQIVKGEITDPGLVIRQQERLLRELLRAPVFDREGRFRDLPKPDLEVPRRGEILPLPGLPPARDRRRATTESGVQLPRETTIQPSLPITASENLVRVAADPLNRAPALPLDVINEDAARAIEALPDLKRRFLAERFPGLFDPGRVRIPGLGLPDPLRELKPPPYELVAKCKENAPHVYTAIIAIEAETVFGARTETGKRGTSYSRTIHDRDGLFFALVDPRYLIDPDRRYLEDPGFVGSVTPDDLENPANWAAIPVPRAVEAIRAGYDRPEPLVLNVNAGDCVKVTLLNALNDRDGKGLGDAPGDARMPPITSLNVDTDWTGGHSDGKAPITAEGKHKDPKDAQPSSRLAITVPLPIMNKGYTFGRPIGKNPVWSLEGVSSTGDIMSINDHVPNTNRVRTAEIERFEFYAGRAVAEEMRVPIWAFVNPASVFKLREWVAELPSELLEAPLLPDTRPALRDAPPPTRGPLPDDKLRQQSVAGALQEIGQLAEVHNERVSGLLGQLGFSAAEVVALEDLARMDYSRRFLPPRLRDELPGLVFFFRSIPFTQMVTIKLDDRAVTVDLETALAIALERQQLDPGRLGNILGELEAVQRGFADAIEDMIALPGFWRIIGWLYDLRVHYVPYAFGALPIKSHADVIGHPAHGLIGAVTVVPQKATMSQLRAPKTPFPGGPERSLLADLCLPGKDPLPNACSNHVVTPQRPVSVHDSMWGATLRTPDLAGRYHQIRQFTLFWQDSLSFRDLNTKDVHKTDAGAAYPLVTNCAICDDSYDWGENGVSYRSEPFHVRLRGEYGNPETIEVHNNLNLCQFGKDFFRLKPAEIGTLPPMPVLRAAAGDEVVVHVVHPGGRARQRAFVTVAQDYDDLFPGFGFPRGALLAPGKAMTASLTRKVEPGCYLWHDGPLHLRAGGVWGLLDVVPAGEFDNPRATSCARARAERQ